MSLLQALTDDQIAILGCGLALAAAFGVMALTGTVRESLDRQKQSHRSAPSRERSTPVAEPSRRRAA